MRRAVNWILAGIRALTAIPVLVLPPVLIAFWAYTYLRDCFELMLAPGVPIEYKYQGETGLYSARAESYRIELTSLFPPDGNVRLVNLAWGPNGGAPLGEVGILEAQLEQKVAVVSVRRSRLTVERDAKGFSLLRGLPKSEGPPSATPFRVIAYNSEVEYVDQTQTPWLAERLSSDLVLVEGVGPNVVVNGRLNISNVGPVRVDARVLNGVTKLTLQSDDMDVVRGLAHARRWTTTDIPLRARSARGRTRADLRVAADGKVMLSGNFTGAVRDVNWPGVANSASGPIDVQFDQRAAIFRGIATDGGLRGSGRGRVAWEPNLTLAVDVDASAVNASALPREVRDQLRGAGFADARYKGLVAYDGRNWMLFGNASAARVSANREVVTGVRTEVGWSGDQVQLRGLRGSWNGSAFTGSGGLNLKTKQLSGYAKAAGVEASRLSSYVRGKVRGEALISGTLDRPLATVDLQGDLSFRDAQGRTLVAGDTRSRIEIKGETLKILRATLQSSAGVGVLSGTANLRRGTIDAQVKAGNLPLEKWLPDIGGVGFASGRITGSLTQPVYRGRAEAYGVSALGRPIPAVRAELVASAAGITADKVRIDQGSAAVTGNLSWVARNGQIRGALSANNIQLSDWTEDSVRGVANLTDIRVAGTVKNPLVTGTFAGKNILAAQAEVTEASGKFTLAGDRLQVPDFLAAVGDGRVRGNGVYNLREKFLRANAELENVKLGPALAGVAPVPIEGTINGKAGVFGRIDNLRGGAGDLRIDGLALSGYQIGNGTATAKFENNLWTGNFEIGQQDRFLIADRITYDPAKGLVDGQVDALNVDLGAVGRAVVANAKKLDPEVATTLQSLEGNAAFSAIVKGDIGRPEVTLRDFIADDLVIRDIKAGKITAQVVATQDRWRVPELLWTRAEGSLRVQGAGTPDGVGEATVAVDGFRSEWLAEIIPGFPNIAGNFKLDFDLAGPWDKLAGRGNASITDIGLGTSADKPNVNIFDINLANNELTAEALFAAEGFSGKADFRAPLAALGIGEGTDKSVAANITLSERNIADLLPESGIVDKARTDGTLAGSLQVGGEIGALNLAGGVRATGKSLGIRKTNPRTKKLEPIQTTLKDYDLNFVLKDNKLVLQDGRIGVNDNGTVAINLEADLKQALGAEADSVEEFLELVQIYGGVAISNVLINERVTEANAPLSVGIDGDIVIAGNLRTPEISTPNPGGIRLSKLDLPTPDEQEPRESGEILIDPIFKDIGLTVVGEARVRAAIANVWLVGGGNISGSLSYPNVTVNTRLTRGIFELPNARINVEPGSPINFSYRATPFTEPFARLDLDLEGRTAISAKKSSDQLERYDIELRIRGNLLDPEGVKISARSDPPELSEQQILAILGQQELIEQLASVAINQPGTNRNQFREAVFGLALPTLSSGLTRSLATSFGLDYLSLEYNAFDGATLSAGKTLAKGLTLTARRQISQTALGPTKYELKLSYRIPGRAGFFQRTRLGVGFTNEVPWRITLDYTIRR